MKKSVAIFEPIYAQDQVQVESEFLPLVIKDNLRATWREFKLLVDMYRSDEHRRNNYTGIFSPKFTLKSKISGEQFVRFVREQTVSDVCFINPFPQIGYWSFNVWMQGERAHPGLVDAAQSLLDASGVDIQIRQTPRHGPNLLAYSNFWVGSERFWDAYVGGVLIPVAEFLENNSAHEAAHKVMTDTSHTDPAPFLPFIIERLFSTFLSFEASLKAVPYLHDGDSVLEYCVNDYERLLVRRMRPQVDTADESGVFDSQLVNQMDIACELWQQQFFDYFAVRPHPHTGRPVG